MELLKRHLFDGNYTHESIELAQFSHAFSQVLIRNSFFTVICFQVHIYFYQSRFTVINQNLDRPCAFVWWQLHMKALKLAQFSHDFFQVLRRNSFFLL
jgi:hypothetical protein